MEQRIPDQSIDFYLKNAAPPYTTFQSMALDLRDARAEIQALRSSLPTAAPSPVPEGQDEKAKGRLHDRLGGKPCDTYEQIDDAVAELVAHYTGVMARLYRHPDPLPAPLPGGDDLREAARKVVGLVGNIDIVIHSQRGADALQDLRLALSSLSPVPAPSNPQERK